MIFTRHNKEVISMKKLMSILVASMLSISLLLFVLLSATSAIEAMQDISPVQPDNSNLTKTVPHRVLTEHQSQLQRDRIVDQAAPVMLTSASSFTIGVNFTGSNYNNSGFIPPDTMGAVGPNHVVELLNGRYAVYNKSGSFIQGSTLDQFWVSAGVTPAGSFSFDPRVVYDKYSGRWFAVAVDNGGGANNVLVAVSGSNDPTAGWTGFAIDSDSDDTHWADFPTLGLNQDVVVVTANMFAIVSGSSAVTTLVLPKSDLTAGTPTVANATIFEETAPNNTGFTLQPAYDQDNGNLPLPLLSSFNKPAGFLKTSSITGTAISPGLDTIGGFIGVTARSSPLDIDQPGPKVDIDASNNRFSGNVVMQHITGRSNPSLWGVQGVDIGGRAAIEWYEIDAVTNAILQSGTISDTSLAFNYPSIAVNDFGDVVIGFSGGDPSTYMSTYVAVGQTNGGVTTLSAPQQTKAGVADYQRLDTSGRNRWGDYSATVIDPSNELHFWTFQEFVSATDIWAIQITEIIISSNTAPVANADSYSTDEDMTLTITASGVLTNDTDVDGDSLTAVLDTDVTSGTLSLNSDGSFTYTPTLNFNGLDTFMYVASDGTLTDTATVTITVTPVNDAPVANDDSYSVDEDTVLNIAASGVLTNDTDIDGDGLTAVLDTDVTSGILNLNSDGSFSYTPTLNFNGLDTFIYIANDGVLTDTATVTITIAAVNDTPVANDDPTVLYSVSPYDPILYRHNPDYTAAVTHTIMVSGFNVSGANGMAVHPLTDEVYVLLKLQGVTGRMLGTIDLTTGEAITIGNLGDNFAGIAFDNNGTLYGVTGDGANVSESFYSINTATATPTFLRALGGGSDGEAIAYNPDDGLMYHTSGRDTNSVWESIDLATLTVTNIIQTGFNYDEVFGLTYQGDGIFIAMNLDQEVVEIAATGVATNTGFNTPMYHRGLIYVPDVYTISEDTFLNMSAPGLLLNDSDLDGDALTAVLDTPPLSGTVVLTASGSFDYIPDPDFCGLDSFTYHANDGLIDSNSATVVINVTCVPDAPLAIGDNYNIAEDTTLNIAASGVLSNDIDVDGDVLTAVLDTDVTSGTLSLNSDGSFIYTPTLNFNGVDTFVYVASDGILTDTALVTITVLPVNDAPQVNAGNDQTVDEGDTVAFSGSYIDPGRATFSNASGEAIHWDFGDGAIATSSLTPTHVYADNGAYTVTLTITDSEGLPASDMLLVTVNNVAPSVTIGSDVTTTTGMILTFTGVFTDPGTADTHTIEWDFGDSATASGSLTPTHAYADPGTYTVTLTVTDDDGGIGSATLTVTVESSGYTIFLPFVVKEG